MAASSSHSAVPLSSWLFPALGVVFFAATTASGVSLTSSLVGFALSVVLLVVLFGTVFAAVHHAEVIAQRIGEPYGTLLLTISVIVIEVAVIATIMLGEKSVPTLARDTVFAVIMIVCNGLVGLCILAGGLRYREQEFQVSGSKLYLSVLIVLSTISLILPNYTLTTPGPLYSALQLAFVSLITIVLYGLFLYTQTVLHRDYFIIESDDDGGHGHHAEGPLWLSVVLLIASLVVVVLLAKQFSLVVDFVAALIGAPPAFSGIVVALLVLLPESIAALDAARKNQLQKSINLALGSSLATIGLTIPAVAIAAYALEKTLVLGLEPREMVLLVMTLILSMLTFATGLTNIMVGMVHLLVFAIFLLLVFVP